VLFKKEVSIFIDGILKDMIWKDKKPFILSIHDGLMVRESDVQDVVDELLFSGRANSHIDTGSWRNRVGDDDKALRWAMLELERRVNNKESVIVTGVFNNWYEFMPLVVIASMYGHELAIGRSAGQKLSIGNVLDINTVVEHFAASSNVLNQFYSDPFSAIQHFRNVDSTISSLVIFPSILHNFLAR
jgi:hypothetical protein